MKNYNNGSNNNYNRYIKTYYDIVVFDEDSRRKFFHKDLRKWEVEAIRFNPHLKVKIVDKRVIDKRDRDKW